MTIQGGYGKFDTNFDIQNTWIKSMANTSLFLEINSKASVMSLLSNILDNKIFQFHPCSVFQLRLSHRDSNVIMLYSSKSQAMLMDSNGG